MISNMHIYTDMHALYIHMYMYMFMFYILFINDKFQTQYACTRIIHVHCIYMYACLSWCMFVAIT